MYNCSKKSTLACIKSEMKESTKPTELYNKVFEQCGGVLGVNSCGALPRNRKQISNIKRSLRDSSSTDPLFSVMEERKKEQSRADPFLRVVQAAPDAMCLLTNYMTW